MNRLPLDRILELPPAERVEIAQQIWGKRLRSPGDRPFDRGAEVELELRWLAFEQNPDEGEPWEDVKRLLLSE